MAERVLTAHLGNDSHRLARYLAAGGYQGLKRALSLGPAKIIEEVKAARLHGRGGAGFPVATKWSFVPRSSGRPVYLCVNADEGEPGTFKDRALLERDPHAVLEGAAIAALAIGARKVFIYVRGEYAMSLERLRAAIAEAEKKGFLGQRVLGSDWSLQVIVHAGAGSYICGEETALIESLEGGRGRPRLRPPFPAQVGLFGEPTVVNNVETLANLPHLMNRGAAWFAALGCEKYGGTKLFALSGHVRRPGLYELPMGTRLSEIIFGAGGGLRPGRKLKAVFPGGVSTPLLMPDQIEVAMDFESLARAGSALGSGAVVVMDDTTCMPHLAARLMKFYAHECCGQCTPCRVGTQEMLVLLDGLLAGRARKGDLSLLRETAASVKAASYCGLGQTAGGAMLSLLVHFEEEFERHGRRRTCRGVVGV